MKKIAIVILNYNTSEQTTCLASQLNRLGYFTVVVDNCSTDDSAETLKEMLKPLKNCEFLCATENGGYAKGNNIGIRYALEQRSFDYIAIMNPDIELLHDNTMENLCDALEQDDKLAGITAVTIFNSTLAGTNSCACRLLSPGELIISDVFLLNKMVSRNYKNLTADKNLVAYVDKIQGCFFIMKRKWFEEIGFFDENTFLYFEEDIIGTKIRQKGLRLGVLLSEMVRHNHGIKDREMLNKHKRSFYNKCMLDSKKYYMLNVLHVTPVIWKMSYALDFTTRKIKDIWS